MFTWIPDWLCDRLHERSKKHGARPFVTEHSDRLETITDLWRRKINQVFDLAGKSDETPTPHRFRHTFARILLQRGVPVADVADLLGDDEDTVREHYARWASERQAIDQHPGCVYGQAKAKIDRIAKEDGLARH